MSGDKRDISDGSPFGVYQFGRTAKTGGIYSTTRIPFSSSIKTTIEASPSCQNDSVYWFMIRGLEVIPLITSKYIFKAYIDYYKRFVVLIFLITFI